MTKKKKRQVPEVEELLARPWCYYCERDFDDLKILIHHQKAKHFKCDRCARRLNTAGGLRVHMEQVHKETLEQVENAIPGREGVDLEIFGTEGIPEQDVAAHNQRILQEYARAEDAKRAASGQSNGPKKPKIDLEKELDPEEIKRKLEAHKRAMAAGVAGVAQPAASQNDNAGPINPQGSLPQGQTYPIQSPPPGYPVTPYSAQSTSSYPPQNSYAPPTAPSPYPTPYQQPGFGQPPTGPAAQFGRGAPQPQYGGYQTPQQPGFSPQQPQYGAPSAPGQFGHPPQSGFGAPLPQPHQIPGLPPRPNVPGLPARPSFAPQPGPSGYGNRGPSGGVPAWSPPPQAPGYGHVQSPPPPPAAGFAPPSGSYGAPPGQPPAPFPAPFPGAPTQQSPPGYAPHPSASPGPPGLSGLGSRPSSAIPPSVPSPSTPVEPMKKLNVAVETPQPEKVEKEAEEKPAEKPGKSQKETRLVYDDQNLSPEEKRALLPKYAAFNGMNSVEEAS